MNVVLKVTIQMLETFEGWKYDSCDCNAKMTLSENGMYRCRKCSSEVEEPEIKYTVEFFSNPLS